MIDELAWSDPEGGHALDIYKYKVHVYLAGYYGELLIYSKSQFHITEAKGILDNDRHECFNERMRLKHAIAYTNILMHNGFFIKSLQILNPIHPDILEFGDNSLLRKFYSNQG